MKQRNIRVMLASEYPEIRSLLRGMIESEDKAVIVGQAENATRALTLARNLRPDVAIIDSYLPHSIGLDALPQSRIGGLDIAQTISDEIPNTRVVLLSCLDGVTSPEVRRGVYLCRETREACVPFTVDELQLNKVVPPGALVFARVVARAETAPYQRTGSSLSEKAIFFGGLAILGGWVLIISLWLAPPGVFLALGGVATLLFGLAVKLASRILK